MAAGQDMNRNRQRPSSSKKGYLVLFGLGLACAWVAGIGGLATTSSVDTWYAELAKPSWTPPNAVFAGCPRPSAAAPERRS